MGSWSLKLLGFLAVVTAMARAQTGMQTNVQQDGLLGPVQTVRTTSTRTKVRFRVPGGATLIEPIWCHDCDYEPDGTRIRQAEASSGKELGNTSVLERDGHGQLTRRSSYDLMSGQLFSEEVFGPFGLIEQKYYFEGKLNCYNVRAYDEAGNLSGWIDYDAKGNEVDRTRWGRDRKGNVILTAGSERNGLHYEEGLDPETRREWFTRFDEAGAILLKWTLADGRYTFFESGPLPDKFGEGFTEKISDKERISYQCHSDSSCDEGIVHYEFTGPGSRNPTSAEWRDLGGKLLYAAYFEYSLDGMGNWTQRKVWVVSPEVTERTLYEEDSRRLMYWSN